MSKQPPPAPTASALRPCPTVIQIGRTPVTGSLPSTIAPPHGAMVLGKLPVTGRTATLDKGRQGPTALAVGAGGDCLDSFFPPVYHVSFPSPSLYRAVSQREGERGERIDESKNVQTTPTRTYCKRNRPLPYCYQNCRTPRHWKFTQHHRTTRPPPPVGGCLDICFSVLGKLPVTGRTIWITVGPGPTALTVGAGGGCLDTLTLLYPFSPLSPLFGRRPDID